MTTTELNRLTVSELRELNKNVVSIIKQKVRSDGNANVVNLRVGMSVNYTGESNKINNERFTILKINKVNANCRSLTDGRKWNIRLANLQPAV